MASPEFLVTHDTPLWATKADAVIGIDLSPWELSGTEKLAVRHVSSKAFEICCIPFFPYDICLGDLVEAEQDAIGNFFFSKLLRASSRLNIRLVVRDDREAEASMRRINGILNQAQCGSEIWKPGYVAADIPSSEAENLVIQGLSALTAHGLLSIERIR